VGAGAARAGAARVYKRGGAAAADRVRMAGAVAYAEWDPEGFAEALHLDDAEKAELIAAWDTYRTGRDAGDLTPAAILRELLSEMNLRYVKAHDDKTCVLGQCNCGAALQLAPQDRQRGVKIVYSWSKAEAGVPPTDIGDPAHEYGKDFTIEAVFVDIAYLKQVIRDDGPCEIRVRGEKPPKKFKDVTLVDMLAASAMQKMHANASSKWFRVGDGVGLLTAPPAHIPRAWRHAETRPHELFAGIVGGALWPYTNDSCQPCSAQTRVLAAVDSVGSAETSVGEDSDLLADEAVMEQTHEMRIVNGVVPYCTFKFTKTREDLSLLFEGSSDDYMDLDRYGSLHKVTDHSTDNLKQSWARAKTTTLVLHALEYIHDSQETTEKCTELARSYYASRDEMKNLLPLGNSIDGIVETIDVVSGHMEIFYQYMSTLKMTPPAIGYVSGIPEDMWVVISCVRDVCTSNTYGASRNDITPSDFFSEMTKTEAHTEDFTAIQFAYYQELLRMVHVKYPDNILLSVDMMRQTCMKYATMMYTIRVIDSLDELTILEQKEEAVKRTETALQKTMEDVATRDDALDVLLQTLPAPSTLRRKETLTGQYWVTLHDIRASADVSAEAAAEAALCWAEWFCAYVDRGGHAKQKCAGVLVRIAAPVTIDENGNHGVSVHTLLGAQQMGYKLCLRPMLRHGGAADATHAWYKKETRDMAFEDGDAHPSEMDIKDLEETREKFHEWVGTTYVPQTGDGSKKGDGEPETADSDETQANNDNLKKDMVCHRPTRAVHACCMRAPSCRYHTLPTWYSRPVPRHHTHLLQQVICGMMLKEMLKGMGKIIKNEKISKEESNKIKWTRYYSVQEKKQVEDGDACLQTLASTLWAEELYQRVQTQKSYFKKNANIICKEMLNEKKRLAIDFYNVSTHS